MDIAESWLREWVDPDMGTEELAHRLTMLGHEVKNIVTYGVGLDDVIVAEVAEFKKHPDADKLSLCKVDNGTGELIDVVCGAPNLVKGMRTPFAKPGVRLPNGLKLRKAKIRGVVSNGMLCSAVELGLGTESDGILSLPDDAKVGTSLSDYLGLPDAVFDLDLTPDRGDCFSVLGLARDVSALTGVELKDPSSAAVKAGIDDAHPVELVEPAGCPRFAGRMIRGIDQSAKSPVWMTERLRRVGLRAISPVVDITNYVMLELGQPLHAYDAGLLNGAIRPRLAKSGETVTLLDEKEVELNTNTLIITDDNGPIGIAGIMGGLSTAVTDQTTDVFFEAAYWPPSFMAGRARAYGMHTDASLRFERGVDPAQQHRAIERATQLLLDIAGGEAGPLVDEKADEHLPRRDKIALRKSQLSRLLGLDIPDTVVTDILGRLTMTVEPTDGGWLVTAPSNRFDIAIEADLIEEVARIHGYDSIPETTEYSQAPLVTVSESNVDLGRVYATLIARDYQEIITYSFIEEGANRSFTGVDSELVLSNPISSEMSVMRASLWPGMVAAAAANSSRQQQRVRFFESSNSFHGTLEDTTEILRVAGLAMGSVNPEQWASKSAGVDFFDVKSDVEAMLMLASGLDDIRFQPVEHAALQPGQAAEIVRGKDVIGVIGKLHPRIAKKFDLDRPVFLFELDANKSFSTSAPRATETSKFPTIRRDIAVIVNDEVSAAELLDAVGGTSTKLIKNVLLFDIYRGKGIEAGRKSVAIGLILQETSRTLTDDDADAAMAAVVKQLQEQFAAELRD